MKPTLGHLLVRPYGTYVKVSHLTAFCAWDSSPHLPVTPALLRKPAWYWQKHAPHRVGYHLVLSFFREMWFVDCNCVSSLLTITTSAPFVWEVVLPYGFKIYKSGENFTKQLSTDTPRGAKALRLCVQTEHLLLWEWLLWIVRGITSHECECTVKG